ncbi:hypothetical protein [Vibrio phage BUCT006]|nr:hypothetical protein [Vibrio phage BUCT006]
MLARYITVGVLGAIIITQASNVYVALGVYICILSVEMIRE